MKGTFRKFKQSGFTIVELVIVIVILGILAAFAVPRFVNLATEARVSAVSGLEGSVRSAAALAHSLWLTDQSQTSVTMEGQTINITNGYPATTDIDDALSSHSGFTFASGVFTKDGATTPASCSVTYAAPTAAGNAPSITPATGGC